MIYLFSPLMILWINIVIILLPDEKNPLKVEPISGKKGCGFIYDLNLPKIKEHCKKNKCTINDYCAALICQTFDEYFKKEAATKKDYQIPDRVRLALPFSFRAPFKKLSDVRMVNDFGALLVDFKPCDNFDQALSYCKSTFGKLKRSLQPFAIYLAQKGTYIYPNVIGKFLGILLTKKFTGIYTNVLASKQPLVMNGKEV